MKFERSKLHPDLHLSYPCDNTANSANKYTSAIVTFLTAGVEEGKGNRIVFTGKDYINGALALGASLTKYMTRPDTLRLLLIREGFSIPPEEKMRLEAVGWTLGVAPNIQVADKYMPTFRRYKTTYTKISAIGLSEFQCTLLLDADTLVVGNIDELMSCQVFDRPEYKVAGTIDYYRGRWYHFNTGSILWRGGNANEMNRVYNLTKDSKFMKRFGSDQIFLNNVYEDRTDIEKNNDMVLDGPKGDRRHWGQVVNLGWQYNAQTHVEVQLPKFWNNHLQSVKIIHYTEKKGWQCPERYGSPPPLTSMPTPEMCNNTVPECFCIEGYRYWDSLQNAKDMIEEAMKKK